MWSAECSKKTSGERYVSLLWGPEGSGPQCPCGSPGTHSRAFAQALPSLPWLLRPDLKMGTKSATSWIAVWDVLGWSCKKEFAKRWCDSWN